MNISFTAGTIKLDENTVVDANDVKRVEKDNKGTHVKYLSYETSDTLTDKIYPLEDFDTISGRFTTAKRREGGTIDFTI